MVRGLFAPAVVAVVVVGFAAACTDGDAVEPTLEPTSTVASPSPLASEAEVVKPERPAAMDRDDAEGAAAAAEYFIELYPYVMTTGDTSEFAAMSHEACGFCAQTLDDVARIQLDQQRYGGGEAHAAIIEVFPRDELTGIFPFDLRVDQAASTIFASDGVEVSRVERTSADLRVEIGRQAGKWVVVEVASAPEG